MPPYAMLCYAKAHGACKGSPGEAPIKNPVDPYNGTCGSGPGRGKAPNVYTSGLEVQWTSEPFRLTPTRVELAIS